MTKVAIHGAAGRMGRRLIALAYEDEQLDLTLALEAPSYPGLGGDAGELAGVGNIGLALTSELTQVDSVIDFTVPAGAISITERCRAAGIPLVMATTGLDEAQTQIVRDASADIPIVWAPNMSLAVNLTMNLVSKAGGVLKDQSADVEIIERHHHFKEDAPSGTALKFGQVIADAMGQTEHVHGREGIIGPRKPTEIGYHALRVGDNPGEHTIVFGLMGETIELTVRATNRDCYATGALTAAKFVAGKAPGIYSMNDVLGLT